MDLVHLLLLIESAAYAADLHIIQIDRENIIIHFRGESSGGNAFFSWPTIVVYREICKPLGTGLATLLSTNREGNLKEVNETSK